MRMISCRLASMDLRARPRRLRLASRNTISAVAVRVLSRRTAARCHRSCHGCAGDASGRRRSAEQGDVLRQRLARHLSQLRDTSQTQRLRPCVPSDDLAGAALVLRDLVDRDGRQVLRIPVESRSSSGRGRARRRDRTRCRGRAGSRSRGPRGHSGSNRGEGAPRRHRESRSRSGRSRRDEHVWRCRRR